MKNEKEKSRRDEKRFHVERLSYLFKVTTPRGCWARPEVLVFGKTFSFFDDPERVLLLHLFQPLCSFFMVPTSSHPVSFPLCLPSGGTFEISFQSLLRQKKYLLFRFARVLFSLFFFALQSTHDLNGEKRKYPKRTLDEERNIELYPRKKKKKEPLDTCINPSIVTVYPHPPHTYQSWFACIILTTRGAPEYPPCGDHHKTYGERTGFTCSAFLHGIESTRGGVSYLMYLHTRSPGLQESTRTQT